MATVVYLGSKEGYNAALNVLSDIAEVKFVESDTENVAKALTSADALLDASMKVHITDDMIRAAANLKMISCATTGSDHIECAALNERNIVVRTLKEDPELLRNITPAAEHSWALLMACARNLKGAFQHVNQGQWVRESFPGIMLKGRVLGLIGCGRIGGWMAKYAQAFGMKVIAFDPYQKKIPDGVERQSLRRLVSVADFISLHVHLSEQTKGMISRSIIEQFKHGSVFINTSRGALVDEAALLEALSRGNLSAVGVDVLEGEPEIAKHPMVQYASTHNNLLITPHCGGFSPDAVRLVCEHAALKIRIMLEL